MLKRLLAVILILVFLTGAASAAGAGQSPYAIRVNRACNTVTIYTMDDAGQYTVPVKAMICSTARAGYVTPLGNYTLDSWRSPWRLMLDGTYGQYATGFYGHYLFHSICYTDDSHNAMSREAYNNLGAPASMGCVRLETADAKWIYDNCPAGTPVTIYDDPYDPGPLGKPERTVDEITPEMYNGWDPTDPAAGNPWLLAAVTTLTLAPEALTLTAGEAAVPELTKEPELAAVRWSSSDESVATVDQNGRIIALSEGTADITVQSLRGDVQAVCTVSVQGSLLPFSDLIPGEWYYPEVRQAMEQGLFHGAGGGQFLPNDTMTRAMVVQVLYNLANRPTAAEAPAFEDVADDSWYRDAVAWAASKEIVRGFGQGRFAPMQPMSRQELAVILWRYAGSPKAEGSLEEFSDGAQVADYAREAVIWMTEQSLLTGSNGMLMPEQPASRAATAAILQRYLQR